MRRKPTIRDVARQAGVSTGTVSAVINDRPSVSETTRRRVQRVIEQLGYTPSPSAQMLSRSPRGVRAAVRGAGVIVKELENPFYRDVAAGAIDFMGEKGYFSFVATSGGDYEKEGALLDAFQNHLVTGAVIAPVLHDHADLTHLFTLRRLEYPFVLLEGVQGLQVNVVSIDNVRAYQEAVSYLISLGHHRVVHFAGPGYTQHTRDRISGMERAFSQSHVPLTERSIVACGASIEDGFRACKEVFGGQDPNGRPTAIACFNDLVAVGAIRALIELGLGVPDDVSVVGFDDIAQASYVQTPLTTVQVPKREIGSRAAALLVESIESESPRPPVREVLESSLIVRASTAPPQA